ncbi:hypothetical protein I203_106799 [Kwoniella mangroviensis CBS 8507]|uniref:uncharacterized protein n=1 Tax=Kwoniella mangroviensis CBS 8507 TaxID=1296122 RepID=UPI00080CD2A8|nr:uncharacterized protein I203_07886 [Kwoniella mangroviensis CBS 8507]OCF63150.1 hypothetical protein I203_07886 [Kwoniella mangroviensis CBS 8507]
MTAETTPSKIPVAISKRSSISLSSTNLAQQSLSNDSVSSQITRLSRSQSPNNINGSTARTGRSSPALSNQQRRWSLLSGGQGPIRKTSFGETTGLNMNLSSSSSYDSCDPVQIKAQIAILQLSLQNAQQRLVDVQNGNTSSLPLTPIDGSSNLPEFEVEVDADELRDRLLDENDEGGRDSPPDPEPPTGINTINGKPRLNGLPHSNPSFDLRSRAVTPARPTSAKLPDGRSRIPQAVVAGSAALHPTPPPSSPARPHVSLPSTINLPDREKNLRSPFLAPESPQPPSPYGGGRPSSSLGVGEGRLSPSPAGFRRASGGPNDKSSASTRVIDGLQTELINARGHLERVKQEVRSAQRVIGSLTRQTEDLKETRERMRVECEGLNNVIARKERLLQEVLERARTAESSLSQHQSTRKALEQSTKKSLSHMTSQLTEAQAGQAKAERECVALRESVKSLRDVWAREVKSVRDEWKKGEEKGKKEREEARQKHLTLVKLVQSQSADRAAIQNLAEKATRESALATESFEAQIAGLRLEIDQSREESRTAKSHAEELASEFVRLRRLMREPRRGSLEDAAVISSNDIAELAEDNK